MRNRDTYPINSEFIKGTIRELGLKKEYIAIKVGIDRNTLRRWVNGSIKTVRYDNLLKLSEIFNCDFEKLIIDDPISMARQQFKTTELTMELLDSLKKNLAASDNFQIYSDTLIQLSKIPLKEDMVVPLYLQIAFSNTRLEKYDIAKAASAIALQAAYKRKNSSEICKALVSQAAITLCEHDLENAERLYLEIIQRTWRAGFHETWYKALSNMAMVYNAMGKNTLAMAFYRSSTRVLKKNIHKIPVKDSLLVNINLGYGELLREAGKQKQALNHMETGRLIAGKAKLSLEFKRATIALAYGYSEIDPKRSLQLIEEYDICSKESGSRISHELTKAHTLIKLGKNDESLIILTQLMIDKPKGLMIAYCHELFAKAHIAKFQYHDALFHLKQSMGHYEIAGAKDIYLEIKKTNADLSQKLKDKPNGDFSFP